MGTGKSKIVVDEIINLIERKRIDCVVILAPNEVHRNWKEQFITHMPRDYDKIEIQVYSSKKNLVKQEKLSRSIIASGKVLVFLMNIEAMSHINTVDYLGRIMTARRKIYFAIDESHKIKNHSAKRTKSVIFLGARAMYRRILTGTEAEEGLIDLYSQFKFLDYRIIGQKFITPFKAFYCQMGGFENREIIAYQNQEILAAKIAPYVFNRRKIDCLDLPDKVYVKHYIEMTPEQEEIYKTLEDQLLYELKSGELVDVTMALNRFLRLQQVLCGSVMGEIIPSNRAKFVAELITETKSKSIVFCRFVQDVSLVGAELDRLGIGCIQIVGETENRLDSIASWREDSSRRALIMTTGVGGVGLTLNESNNTIYYSNSWSATDRKQSEDRNHRIGQVNKVTYHDVIVRKTIDEQIYNALRSKTNLAEKFRELMNQKKYGEMFK